MRIDLNGKQFDTEAPESVFVNGDCMEYMKLFPDKYFDLAIVDPPYGINANNYSNVSGWKGHNNQDSSAKKARNRLNQGAGKLKDRALQRMMCEWDATPPGKDYFDELFRVSRNQIIWGGNYFDLPPTRGIIVWDKEQPWENFSQVELAWTSFDQPAAIFRMGNAGQAGSKIHPTQKPVKLYQWLVGRYAQSGDSILDTHVGSASSLIAYHGAGHTYVGFEILKDYYDAANERLQQAAAQTTIFDLMADQGKQMTVFDYE